MDYFAILDLPRRPWLDPELLKERFHRLAAGRHPDVAPSIGAGAFTELNAAFATLRDPARRLRHLLEIQFPTELGRPPHLSAIVSEIFPHMAASSQRLNDFERENARASTPLMRALLTEKRLDLERETEAIAAAIETANSASLEELRLLDAAWNPSDPALGARLAELQQQFGFLSRWHEQAREALFQLRGRASAV